MTSALQVFAQPLETVDLAVTHQCQGAFDVRKRLVAAGEVDDGEPTHADAAGAVEVIAVVVRSTVHRARGHGHERRPLDRGAVHLEEAEDSTNGD